MIDPKILFFAIVCGILPAVFWLWFWLKEDSVRPEPRGLILLVFFGGMISTMVALPFQRYINGIFGMPLEHYFNGINLNIALAVFFWATIEETVKFSAAYFFALNKKDYNEPIDAIIYLITAALGFAAAENIFYLIQSLTSGNITDFTTATNFRFIGPTMLHTVSSGIIGFSLAFSFYQPKIVKILFVGYGIVLAIILHTSFNLFIIYYNNRGNLFLVFSVVWVCIIFFIIFIEKIKKLKN